MIASRCVQRIARETPATLLELTEAEFRIPTLLGRGAGCVNILLFSMFAARILIRDNKEVGLDNALVETVA